MGAMASEITSLAIVHSNVYSGADQRKHQSTASLAFLWGIYRWLVNSPHRWPVTRKMFPFDDVIMTVILRWVIDTVNTNLYPFGMFRSIMRFNAVYANPCNSNTCIVGCMRTLVLWYQKQVSQAGKSNCIPQKTEGCNYLFLPEMPASGTLVLICGHTLHVFLLQVWISHLQAQPLPKANQMSALQEAIQSRRNQPSKCLTLRWAHQMEALVNTTSMAYLA